MAAPPLTGRRRLAARGTLINSGFQIGLGGLNFVKSLIAAGFLTATDFAVWGIVFLAVGFTVQMKSAAVADKYIQQEEPDQEEAFQKAFTLELLFALLMLATMAALAPVIALAYGQGELLLPALAVSLVIPGIAMQTPSWIYYRRMDFFRQRILTAIDPVVGFVVTIALAVAGLGYWSLVIGLVVGSWAAGIAAVLASPYSLKLRYDRSTMREYVSFSWPIVLAVASGTMIGMLSLFFGDLALGLAGAGAIALAGNFTSYTDRVDRIVTTTIYPAVCRVRDRRDLLLETFIKSNRLTLMWGMPFGIGLSLFASDLVHFGVGDQWNSAIVLLQVFGVVAAINHIGFNWDAFYRAIAKTRPLALVNVAYLLSFCATAIPLLFAYGLSGFAAGLAITTVVSLALRVYYLAKLFPGFEILRYTLRAIAPTLPAAGAVLVIRILESGQRSAGTAVAEVVFYLLVTVGLTLVFERRLIREMLSYLRRDPQVAAAGT